MGKSRLVWVLLRRLLDDENRTGLALDGMTFRSGLQSARNHGTLCRSEANPGHRAIRRPGARDTLIPVGFGDPPPAE
jgi:hypothetical protein